MFNVGDVVWYRDNGPTDLGVVTRVVDSEGEPPGYEIMWLDGMIVTHAVDQLCREGEIPNEPLYECEK